MLQPIKLNEKMSLNRPVWTSESKTGMWDAHKHLHVSRMDRSTFRRVRKDPMRSVTIGAVCTHSCARSAL